MEQFPPHPMADACCTSNSEFINSNKSFKCSLSKITDWGKPSWRNACWFVKVSWYIYGLFIYLGMICCSYYNFYHHCYHCCHCYCCLIKYQNQYRLLVWTAPNSTASLRKIRRENSQNLQVTRTNFWKKNGYKRLKPPGGYTKSKRTSNCLANHSRQSTWKYWFPKDSSLLVISLGFVLLYAN